MRRKCRRGTRDPSLDGRHQDASSYWYAVPCSAVLPLASPRHPSPAILRCCQVPAQLVLTRSFDTCRITTMPHIQAGRVNDVMPESGWFPRYVYEAQRLTDAPGIYHVVCGLAALSAVVCKTVFAQFAIGKDIRIEPLHLWTLLIGASGNHKGTALLRATELITGIVGSRYRSPTGSRQGIEDVLEDEPHPIWIMEEAPDWFQMYRAACMRGGAAFWCNLYDGRIRPRNLAGGAQQNLAMGDQALSSRSVFFAAGSTDGMLEYTKPIDWTGGLLSRMMIVTAGDPAKPKPIGFSWQQSIIDALLDRLRMCLLSIPQDGIIKADAHAVEMYAAWSDDLVKQLRGLHRTHNILGRRLDNHCMRSAALFAISRRSPTITTSDILAATRLARYSLDSIRSLPIA